jgi:hypothetical protein
MVRWVRRQQLAGGQPFCARPARQPAPKGRAALTSLCLAADPRRRRAGGLQGLSQYGLQQGLAGRAGGLTASPLCSHRASAGCHRGARRLIAGADGGLYYTRDHYASFVVLREPR